MWAEKALHKVNALSQIDFCEVEALLLSTHNESSGDTDFILADSQSCTISRISEGVSSRCDRAYIGDAEVYSTFSNNLATAIQNHEEVGMDEKYLMFCSLGTAFQKTLKESSSSSVGGLDISICQKDGYFGYQHKVSVEVGPQKLEVGINPTKIPFGNVEKGSFSVNILSSDPGNCAQVLGVHLHFGNIGLL
jgi:hypothetical protein